MAAERRRRRYCPRSRPQYQCAHGHCIVCDADHPCLHYLLMAQELPHNTAKASFAGRWLAERATAFWLVTCFLLSCAGYGQLAPVHVVGQTAFANRDTGVATNSRAKAAKRGSRHRPRATYSNPRWPTAPSGWRAATQTRSSQN